MFLEVHDVEAGNSLRAKVNHLDYDYMAEQWVKDLMADEVRGEPHKFTLDRFVLMDGEGVRATWKVSRDENNELIATLVEKADRFTGEWRMNLPYNPLRHPR